MRIEQSEFHDHLVRGLTHKMNNILSLFHGYLGLLIEGGNHDHQTMDGLLRIRDSADAASRLIDRTKALARPSSSIWREIAPESLLKTLAPSLDLLAERGVRIEIDCDPELPDIWADLSRLRMAIKEVVKNACEASPAKGAVQISAKTYRRTVRGRARRDVEPAPAITWVSISVTDSGEGIPPELTAKIFQPFFSTKSKRDSMGLGLSVALGLVEQLGGAIRVQSKPGRTCVKLLLPSRASAE